MQISKVLNTHTVLRTFVIIGNFHQKNMVTLLHGHLSATAVSTFSAVAHGSNIHLACGRRYRTCMVKLGRPWSPPLRRSDRVSAGQGDGPDGEVGYLYQPRAAGNAAPHNKGALSVEIANMVCERLYECGGKPSRQKPTHTASDLIQDLRTLPSTTDLALCEAPAADAEGFPGRTRERSDTKHVVLA